MPRAIFPWVPIDVLPSPALWLCGSLLHAPFQIHLLSGTPCRLCFPRPLGSFLFGFLLGSFCVCLRCLSFFACLFAFALYVSSLWPLCASPFALGLSVVRLVVFVVASLPPPLGCFRVASWPSNFLVLLVPPSGYLVASCDGLVALPYCLECCGALLPRFILLHGSKGLWPCVGYLINPLHHGAYVVVGLCAPSLRYSSSWWSRTPLEHR